MHRKLYDLIDTLKKEYPEMKTGLIGELYYKSEELENFWYSASMISPDEEDLEYKESIKEKILKICKNYTEPKVFRVEFGTDPRNPIVRLICSSGVKIVVC